jgi:hypothetical protein
MFGQTVTTSSDVLRQFNARGRASPRKWLILDGDSNGAGIVPLIGRGRDRVPDAATSEHPNITSPRA